MLRQPAQERSERIISNTFPVHPDMALTYECHTRDTGEDSLVAYVQIQIPVVNERPQVESSGRHIDDQHRRCTR